MRRRVGRPGGDPEVKPVLLKLTEANPLWGAPRIHGELLKLWMEVSEGSASPLNPR
jgi:putative transposase